MIKKLFKHLAIVCSALGLGLALVATPIAAIPVQAAMPETSDTQQEIIAWVYAKSDTKLYKRLFNYSTGHWIGDWIYVRDLLPGE